MAYPEEEVELLKEGLSVEGKRFMVTGHDYRFEGTIQTIFRKRNGKLRVVVESDDGVCLIQNLSNVHPVVSEPLHQMESVPDWKE